MPRKTPDIDGTNVLPAPVMNVKVETDDFVKAVQGDQYNCALVWAIHRKFPQAKRVAVNTESVRFSLDGMRYVYPSDETIVERVIRPLDTGGEVQPTTVKLHDGYAKTCKVTTEAQETTHNQEQREYKVKVKKGLHTPISSNYKRLMVVRSNDND